MASVGYAVVDVETTGLFAGGWHNRIAEIGIVLVSRDGAITDTWSTLVNPERDLGPQHVHGIKASDARLAPTFVEIAADVGALLENRIVVAHNLAFDARFLRYEFDRLGFSVPVDVELGLCTMAMAQQYLRSPSRSLAACCASVGIRQGTAHSALYDAQAAAELLAHMIRLAGQPEPWSHLFTDRHVWPVLPDSCGRTQQRGALDARPQDFLARLVDRLPAVRDVPHADDYLALLDRALLDRHLSASEQDALIDLAESLGISFDTAMALHRRYLDALAQAAWQDDVVTDTERQDLLRVSGLLGLSADDVDAALRDAATSTESQPWGRFRLHTGDVVVFTGQLDGDREEWERRAVAAGLRVTGSGVTRRTRLVVAADPDSLSGKARKARQYGIPIVTASAFEAMLGQLTVRPRTDRPSAVDSQLDAPPTRADDGRTMIGHVIVSRGADEDGVDVIAVWQVNTEGTSTAAWTVPAADALTDADFASGLLDRTAGRALAGWDVRAATELLTDLARVAGRVQRDWAASAVTVPSVLSEIATVRADYAKAVTEERQLKRNVAAVEWEVEVPDPLPLTPDGLRRHAGLARPPGAPVIGEVLLTADLLRWSVARWQETMTVLGRREYLQRTFGRPRQLPPGWEARLADAHAGR
jgi:DNA polymerase III subunit epsilon